MQHYTPAQGYSYTPPSGPVTTKSLDAVRHSRANSPVIEAAQSQQLSSQPRQQNQDSKDERALLESLLIGQRYKEEFMDENPLVGEPGSLVFSSTQTHLKAQQAAKAAQSAPKSVTDMRSTAVSTVSSPMPDLKVSTQLRKGSKTDKEKTPVSAGPGGKPKPSRRRSRHTGSPED
jgi:mediator of RNA polymerase II transcription subunit 6